MEYEEVRSFAAFFGLIYFIIMFLGVVVYALWPGNKRKFDEAARMPLRED